MMTVTTKNFFYYFCEIFRCTWLFQRMGKYNRVARILAWIQKEKRMKDILVVDDDSTMREVIKRILECEGIVAHCVSNGREALETLRVRSFPLMITDLHMPGLDGLELSRKGLEIAPGMRIIMDTSDTSPKNVTMAQEIGIATILTKPFLPNEMMDTIRLVMGNKELACI